MANNTHIANNTGMAVRIVLTDNDGRNTTKVILPGKYICIPTPGGRVSVDVFRPDPTNIRMMRPTDYVQPDFDGNIRIKAAAANIVKEIIEGDDSYQNFLCASESNYTDDANRSFIINKILETGNLDIVRAKYGSIWEEDNGPR